MTTPARAPPTHARSKANFRTIGYSRGRKRQGRRKDTRRGVPRAERLPLFSYLRTRYWHRFELKTTTSTRADQLSSFWTALLKLVRTQSICCKVACSATLINSRWTLNWCTAHAQTGGRQASVVTTQQSNQRAWWTTEIFLNTQKVPHVPAPTKPWNWMYSKRVEPTWLAGLKSSQSRDANVPAATGISSKLKIGKKDHVREGGYSSVDTLKTSNWTRRPYPTSLNSVGGTWENRAEKNDEKKNLKVKTY